MTWTPERHAEYKRTLAMLKRCAGNGDEGPIGFRDTTPRSDPQIGRLGRGEWREELRYQGLLPRDGEARTRLAIPTTRVFRHAIIRERLADIRWIRGTDSVSMPSLAVCETPYGSLVCTCGHYDLAWETVP